MEIDATCIVQIIHFIIAYYMLKQFLFKSLVREVCAEDKAMHELQQALETKKTLVKEQEQAMRSQWLAYQQEFVHLTPQLDMPNHIIHNCSPFIECANINEVYDKTALIEELKRAIVTKVRRVH